MTSYEGPLPSRKPQGATGQKTVEICSTRPPETTPDCWLRITWNDAGTGTMVLEQCDRNGTKASETLDTQDVANIINTIQNCGFGDEDQDKVWQYTLVMLDREKTEWLRMKKSIA